MISMKYSEFYQLIETFGTIASTLEWHGKKWQLTLMILSDKCMRATSLTIGSAGAGCLNVVDKTIGGITD